VAVEPAIGLLGHRGDPQLVRLATELRVRGASVLPFDLTDLPAHVACHWQGEELRFGELRLDRLGAVYARTAHFPAPVAALGLAPADAERQLEAPRESGALMNAWLAELAARLPVVNPPEAHRYHRQKPFLYASLQRAGVPVPAFAVGSDLAAAARFVAAQGEEAVLKPLMGGPVQLADFSLLRSLAAEIDRRPFLLQRRVRGRSLRAYVVGGRVVAVAEMQHAAAVLDWREALAAIAPCTASPALAQACEHSAAALGLAFCALDLEEEGSGAAAVPWVIDVNPAPMFAAFEARSGLDVAGPLSDHLLQRARAHHAAASARGAP